MCRIYFEQVYSTVHAINSTWDICLYSAINLLSADPAILSSLWFWNKRDFTYGHRRLQLIPLSFIPLRTLSGRFQLNFISEDLHRWQSRIWSSVENRFSNCVRHCLPLKFGGKEKSDSSATSWMCGEGEGLSYEKGMSINQVIVKIDPRELNMLWNILLYDKNCECLIWQGGFLPRLPNLKLLSQLITDKKPK